MRGRTTPLQRTVLRWIVQLGGLERREVLCWVHWCGRMHHGLEMRFAVPMMLEDGAAHWRVCETQVQALRREGLITTRHGRAEATEAGLALLGGG